MALTSYNPTHFSAVSVRDSNGNYINVASEIESAKADTANQKKQTILLSKFYQKLSKKTDVKIVCQGDSLTYGQDTVSADKVAASGTTDNGVAHTRTHVPIPYPEQLQANLRAVYHNTSTVINKGYSGDWVANSLLHWTDNDTADVAFIMLGTNDAYFGSSYVPDDIEGDLDKYITDMRTLIDRYTEWDTAVVLLAPPRTKAIELQTSVASSVAEPFRAALFNLGAATGIPVIDTEEFFNGCDPTYWSDTIHFNTKGYAVLAARLTSLLVGYGPHSAKEIRSGDVISIRSSRDSVVDFGVNYTSATASPGAEETTDGQGILASLTATDELWWSFKALEDNLILIPVLQATGTTLTTTLDFNGEQGSALLAQSINQIAPVGTKPLAQIASTGTTILSQAYDGRININTPNDYIHITNRGWHNISVANTGEGNGYFYGFVVMSYKDFIGQQNIPEARTATADGLTTGTISVGTKHVTVTSDDANKIIILPPPVLGLEIILQNGATGYELRSSAPATIGINGGVGADAESAVAAATTVIVKCVSATNWIASTVTAAGVVGVLEVAAA